MKDFKPKPKRYDRCFICGERLLDGQFIGGKVKGAGILCAHLDCFKTEQAERKAKK